MYRLTVGSSINLADLTYQNICHLPLEILFRQVGGDVDSRLILTWLIDFNLSTRTCSVLEAGAAVLVIDTSPLIWCTSVTEVTCSSSSKLEYVVFNCGTTTNSTDLSYQNTCHSPLCLTTQPHCLSSHLQFQMIFGSPTVSSNKLLSCWLPE